MAYEKTLWKDRVVEKPNTYRTVENPDGTITLYPITGQVIEKGTPISAANLNKIENGIVEVYEHLDNIETQTATKQEVDVERKRIDTFIKLPEGSTTENAELADGRIGHKGEVYNNIGEAIRNQIHALNNAKVDDDIVLATISKGDFINVLMTSSGNAQTFENGNYGHYEINCNGGETYKYTGTAPSITFPAFLLLDSNNKVLDYYPKPLHADKITDFIFRTPTACSKIYINKHKDSAMNIYKVTYNGFKDRVKQIETLAHEAKNDLTNKIDKIINYKKADIVINKGLISVKDFSSLPNTGCHAYHEVTAGQKLQITGFSWSSNTLYPVYAFLDNNNTVLSIFGEPNKKYTNLEVTVPTNAVTILISGNSSCGLNILTEHPLTNFIEDKINNKLSDTEYELKNIERRLLKIESKNSFEWKSFDKAYFIFVIDDSNQHLAPMYELFHSYSIPLSTACMANYLNTVHSTSKGLTVKEINDLIVKDGGEVLAHYSGNLADKGHTDSSDRTYLTNESDWLARTRDVKKILEDNNYNVRGIIRADYTVPNTVTGEDICRRYFDYSDNLGKSKQYNISRRFFGNSSVQELTTYIDNCCKKPGVYPFCLHGTEPSSSIENMRIILDHIKSKGNKVEVTTYANVFDNFGSDKLTKLIETL